MAVTQNQQLVPGSPSCVDLTFKFQLLNFVLQFRQQLAQGSIQLFVRNGKHCQGTQTVHFVFQGIDRLDLHDKASACLMQLGMNAISLSAFGHHSSSQ